MSEAKVERAYYDSGQLRWEGTIKNGKPVGWNRHWHENGVLKHECFFDVDGLEHGLVKTWTKEGELLGECEFDHGTGISKSWYENGQLESENYYVRGKECGRSRMWWDDGSLMGTTYYIHNRKVSKKKYLEACKSDPTLPRYEVDNDAESEEPEIVGTYQKRGEPASEREKHHHDEFIKKFLRKPNRGEARLWLKGDENRYIGEMSHEDSLEFVEEGYRAGATSILAVEIEQETTNCLIVYLPPSGSKRKRVFEWCSKVVQENGYEPYDDWGQNECFLFFS